MDLPKRKPTRLREFDYSTPGAYFVTVCTHNRQKILCDIVGEGLRALPSIKLTQIGTEIENSIKYINENCKGIAIDKYVIMPNHIHLIVNVSKTGGHGDQAGGHRDPPLRVPDVIGKIKSFTTHKYGKTLWQRSFHDHIIRREGDYLKILNYIETNPAKWKNDCFYTE